MRRRRFPRVVPPPVASARVPDVARDRGVKLSRAERRALKERQLVWEGFGVTPEDPRAGG